MPDGRRIVGNPRGSVPVHPVASVAVRVDLDPYLSLEALASGTRERRDPFTRQVTAEYVQGYSGLSRRTLQTLVNDDTDPLPSYRVGGKLLVRRSEFDAWMARRKNTKPLAAAQLAQADARALLTARPKK